MLGLRIFEAIGADITDLGEEHSHRVPHVCGQGTKVVQIPLPPPVGWAIDRAIATGPAGRSCSTTAAPGWTAMPPCRRIQPALPMTGSPRPFPPHSG